MPDIKYTAQLLAPRDSGLVVGFRVDFGVVPRFHSVTIPWEMVCDGHIMREIVIRHTRSMEAPPPWNTGDPEEPLF
jgi:hypothetical protein